MSTRAVYQCDADGVYVGIATSYESPLEPGVFPLPAGCVEQAPPEPAAQQVAQMIDGVWELVPDHRGETWYLGQEPIIVDFVGNPRERGLSLVPVDVPVPSTEPTLAELRVVKLSAIVAKADELLSIGALASDALHIALDDGSRGDLTAMATAATNAIAGTLPWPESYSRGWISIENVRIPLPTPAAGLTLAAKVGDYYAAIIQHRRDLKDAALAAETVDALDAIDISAGWPA